MHDIFDGYGGNKICVGFGFLYPTPNQLRPNPTI